jgi:hypothetical protein
MCLFFGHRFVEKVHCGSTTKYFMGDSYKANVYNWQANEFCTRCGKINKNYEKR